MDSCEIVRRTIEFRKPYRLGFDYFAYGKRHTDIVTSYLDWEFDNPKRHSEWIEGDRKFFLDAYGNTWVRLAGDQTTKGLPYRGIFEESWDALESFAMPRLSIAASNDRVRDLFLAHPELFKAGCLFNGSFSILTSCRGFANLMMDLLTNTAQVREACQIIDDELVEVIKGYASAGANGIHIMEDWGLQNAALLSRRQWDSLFAPGYERLCRTAHDHGMKVILHSCGMLWDLIESFLQVGIDVLQFDQTANYGAAGQSGIERLRSGFGGRVTFFCPVDIQQTIGTGNYEKIEEEVRQMVFQLGSTQGGFIAKSYGRGNPTYLSAIGCRSEWNDFAFDCFLRYGRELFQTDFTVPQLAPAYPRTAIPGAW